MTKTTHTFITRHATTTRSPLRLHISLAPLDPRRASLVVVACSRVPTHSTPPISSTLKTAAASPPREARGRSLRRHTLAAARRRAANIGGALTSEGPIRAVGRVGPVPPPQAKVMDQAYTRRPRAPVSLGLRSWLVRMPSSSVRRWNSFKSSRSRYSRSLRRRVTMAVSPRRLA